ncbi:MAG: GNAT family N-acetyltransferase [Caulobacteraceae bacterium]
MFETRVVHPSELTDREVAAWSAMQALEPKFASPLLGPHFARAVGNVREDARVALYGRGGRLVGVLPHHRRPLGFARPIGAPFSDYHGLVTGRAEGLSGPEALSAARLAAFKFSGLVDPFGVFGQPPDADARGGGKGYRIVLGDEASAYFAALGRGSRNRSRNYRRYSEKLRQDFGPLRMVSHEDRGALEELLAWKRGQIERTGVQDFLGGNWAAALLADVFHSREGPLQGLALSLFAGERQVAGHFGVRLGAHFHPWIGASDPALDAYSPGLVHQWMAIEAMPELNLRVYDLGPGAGHWKALFANSEVPIGEGLATADGPAGRYAKGRERLWALPGLVSHPIAERLRRRLDQIAQSELTLSGRVAGVVNAIAGYDRRTASRPANASKNP